MRTFLDENFLLMNETAKYLYHQHAANQPIIDYHCHLPPDEIAADRKFENISAIWLNGDHYKWRAMRTNGVDESFITGSKSPEEKFLKWAETVPFTMRNPLYHWTHLELQRYFGINTLLNGNTGKEIYDATTAMLQQPEFSTKNLLRKMKVQLVGTTDDPTDSLEHHIKLKEQGFEIKVLPSFRPDKAMAVENVDTFNAWVNKLEAAAGIQIANYQQFIDALISRYNHFEALGCKISDHGLEAAYAADFKDYEVKRIFSKIRSGFSLNADEVYQFKSAMLYFFAEEDHKRGWVQQFHLGALRNNNSRMLRTLGPDTGFDSIGDFSQAAELAKFLNRLDNENKLAKTIIYNLNPSDNELFATMIGNFNDGSEPGKIQFGSAWWFLDQKQGMTDQINALSNMGLLSRFVGMLTDSRSFLSFPRHEYFRRLLCNLIGTDVENGELPKDLPWLGKMVEDISYFNAKQYFKL